jgi:hypothetical protein
MSFILDSLKRAETERPGVLDRHESGMSALRSHVSSNSHRTGFHWIRLCRWAVLILAVSVGLIMIFVDRLDSPVSSLAIRQAPEKNEVDTKSSADTTPLRHMIHEQELGDLPLTPHSPVRPLRQEARGAAAPVAKNTSVKQVGAATPPFAPREVESKPAQPSLSPDDVLFDGQINIHSFSGDPAERFVYINFRRYHEGQRIGVDGPVIDKITAQGMLLIDGDRQQHVQINQ